MRPSESMYGLQMEITALVPCLLSVLPVQAYLSMQQYSSCNANVITGDRVETRHVDLLERPPLSHVQWDFRQIPFNEISISSPMLIFRPDLWNVIGRCRTWSERLKRLKEDVEEVCRHQFTSPSAFPHPLPVLLSPPTSSLSFWQAGRL